MRRFILAIAAVIAASAVIALPASANTTQQVTMTFTEPIHPSITCPGFPDVGCGSGQVVPLGQATEIVIFGACGQNCDLRTITLADGTLILEEPENGGAGCPANCQTGQSVLSLFSGTLNDRVVGGTGAYAGATGTLTGTFRVEVSNVRPAGTATIKLSGTITY